MEGNGKQVYVVGPRKAQNELLAGHIASCTGIGCAVFPSLGDLAGGTAGPLSTGSVILKDCPPLAVDSIRQRLQNFALAARSEAPPLLALFNVAAGRGIERETFPLGVKGFFYDTDGPETLVKGVSALFGGELWMSRKVMGECLLQGHTDEHNGDANGDGVLTPREIEVLAKIAAGSSNDYIANQFCISPHTVKTHVYRIFRKIGAANRLQAALWAAKNL